MQKIWTFVKDAKTTPDTLMDVPQNVPCVVRYMSGPALLIRIRVGSDGFSMTETGLASARIAHAAEYRVVGYYGTPPVEPLPTCLSEAKPYQLYKLSNYKWLYWKGEGRCVWSLDSTGRVMQETAGATPTLLAVRINSLSDLTAVLTEV